MQKPKSFFRVFTETGPLTAVADCEKNADSILGLMARAEEDGAAV